MKLKLLSLLTFLTIVSTAQTPVKTNIVTGLAYPVAFAITPDGRFISTLKGGQIRIHSATGASLGTFYNLTDSTYNDFERGLLGIEIDPDFTNNHYVYAYYVHRCCSPNYNGSLQALRVVRFTENNNVGTNPAIILSITVSNTIAGNHVGGNLHFRPSEPDKLYVSIGDLAVQSGAYAQQLNRPFGKMLRINKNGTIPTDNPYYDDGNPATGNDDRIWSLGHRNPFDFTFSTINDSLYISENGLNTWDEVNYGLRGKNYGWPSCEGNHVNGSTTTLCNNANFVNPIVTWPSPLPAITGIIHYSGSTFPQYQNHLIVADNDYGRIYDVELGNSPLFNTLINRTQIMDVTGTTSGAGGLTTLRQGADGCIYAMNGGYIASGYICKLCPVNVGINNPVNADLNWNILPNVISDNKLNINIQLNDRSTINLIVYSLTGQEILNYTAESNSGTYSKDISIPSNTGSGIYFAKVIVSNSQGYFSSSRKVVIE